MYKGFCLNTQNSSNWRIKSKEVDASVVVFSHQENLKRLVLVPVQETRNWARAAYSKRARQKRFLRMNLILDLEAA